MKATPWGFRDILPEEAQTREDIADTVKACFKRHGYLPIETPLLEDKGSIGQGGRSSDDTPFKLFDDDGRLLVVRPDNTLSIVRLVSTRMLAAALPLRLRYEAPVVREQARYAGASRQFTQLGFELIGEASEAGDAELVHMVAEAMQALEIPSWRVVCGSVRPFLELLDRCGDDELASTALDCVHANNLVDLDNVVRAAAIPEAMKRAICEVPRTFGGIDALDRIDGLLQEAGVEERLTGELRALADSFGEPSADSPLSFDFSILNSFDYYTGLVLKVYAGDLPDPVGSGGRYDAIFGGVFPGRERTPAAGFAFSLERLESACQACAEQREASADHAAVRAVQEPLRIAVPKGSLNTGTIEALEAVGLDVSALRDPGRRLIVSSRDMQGVAHGLDIGEVEFVIVRASDAPAFVAGGGADCGFCGRDSLIEADLSLLELLDMGYGACRFIEAEPADRAGQAERAYARRGCLRVATKYPRIAAAWYERRGIAADIVSLHGNIELGPIVGMTDRIVDITATGTTLRENNLVITGEIMECTARFFVNPGRARLDARVRELARRLSAYAG